MIPNVPQGKQKESTIQTKIATHMRSKGWYVMKIPGGLLLAGFPDLFACHKEHGVRLVEIKQPEFKGSKFTPAQMQVFPELARHGCPVWILTDVREYELLFKPANWHIFFGRSL